MDLLNQEKFLKVMSVTRFHFVAGMPLSGADQLMALLSQNPGFQVERDGPAQPVLADLFAQCDDRAHALSRLDREMQTSILRAAVDALHHKRPMDSTVLDHNDDWLQHLPRLAALFPLSRFIVLVRDPALLAAELADLAGEARSPASLMASDGAIGQPLSLVQDALKGPDADRLLLIDRDRLANDPVRVLDALYRFLRVPPFEHDVRPIEGLGAGPRAPKSIGRRVIALDGSKRKPQDVSAHVPIWRRVPRTEATLLLSESG